MIDVREENKTTDARQEGHQQSLQGVHIGGSEAKWIFKLVMSLVEKVEGRPMGNAM